MSETHQTGDELFATLEADTSKERHRGQVLRRLAEAYDREGEAQTVRETQWEMLAFDLMPGGTGQDGLFASKWFRPVLSGRSKEGESIRYPREELFGLDVLEYYSRRAMATANPIHKSRYYDILWEAGKDHRVARAAVDAHLACVPIYLDNDWGHELGLTLQRALSLSAQLGDKGLQSAAVAAATGALSTLQVRQLYGRYSEPLTALLKAGRRTESIDWAALLLLAREATEHFASDDTTCP